MLLSQLLPASVLGRDLSLSAPSSSVADELTPTTSVTDLEKAPSFNATSKGIYSQQTHRHCLSTVRLLLAHIGFVVKSAFCCIYIPTFQFQCRLDIISCYNRRSVLLLTFFRSHYSHLPFLDNSFNEFANYYERSRGNPKSIYVGWCGIHVDTNCLPTALWKNLGFGRAEGLPKIS